MRVKIIKVDDTPEGKLAKFRSLMFQHIVSKRDRVKRAGANQNKYRKWKII